MSWVGTAAGFIMDKQRFRLTEQDVIKIRQMLFNGYSQPQTARNLLVSAAHINRIANGLAWTHIPWPNGASGRLTFKEVTGRDTSMKSPQEIASGQAVIPATSYLPSKDMQQAEREPPPTGFIWTDDGRLKIDPKHKPAMMDMLEQIKQNQEDEFMEQIKPKKPRDFTDNYELPPQEEGDNSTWGVKFLSWDEVLEQAPNNELVIAVQEDETKNLVEDELSRRAIGIVFNAIPEKNWGDDGIVKLVKQARDALEVDRDKKVKE